MRYNIIVHWKSWFFFSLDLVKNRLAAIEELISRIIFVSVSGLANLENLRIANKVSGLTKN